MQTEYPEGTLAAVHVYVVGDSQTQRLQIVCTTNLDKLTTLSLLTDGLRDAKDEYISSVLPVPPPQ